MMRPQTVASSAVASRIRSPVIRRLRARRVDSARTALPTPWAVDAESPRFRQRRRKARAHPHAVKPFGQLSGAALQRPLRLPSDVFEGPYLPPAVGVLGPAADDPAVPPRG